MINARSGCWAVRPLAQKRTLLRRRDSLSLKPSTNRTHRNGNAVAHATVHTHTEMAVAALAWPGLAFHTHTALSAVV